MEGFERACGGSREKVLQSRKASTAQNMKFSGEKIIAIKSDNILPYFKANLCLYQTLPLSSQDNVQCSKTTSDGTYESLMKFYLIVELGSKL